MAQTVVNSPLVPGATFLEKYRVDQLLGEGGMGIVFAATHLELQDRVAIKLLRPEASGNSEIVTRFLREARAAAQLRSENVVRVYDVGRLESGEPYMIMELLDGHDLASGPLGPRLSIGDAVDYVIQACDAMIVAHELGVVHRDLKPANLFLTVDRHGVPTVKVLDFGISKLQQQGAMDGALTQESAVMGSPLYMSPEQVRSAKTVDARADIWSLGTILFELITARTPFEGDTLGAILTAVAMDTPPAMGTLRPNVPPGLEAIVATCLEKDPDRRYQSATELQAALLPHGSMRSQAKMALRGSVTPPAHVASESSAPPTAAAAQTDTTWADTGSRTQPPSHPAPTQQRRRPWVPVAALAVLASIGGGVALVARGTVTSAPISSAAAAASEPIPSTSSSPGVDESAATAASAVAPSASAREERAPSPARGAPPRPAGAAPQAAPVPRRVEPAQPAPTDTPAAPAPPATAPAPPPAAAPAPAKPPSSPRTDRSSPLDIDFK